MKKKIIITTIIVLLVGVGVIAIRSGNEVNGQQIINQVTVENLNQVNSLGQKLFIKTIPAFQTLEGLDRFTIFTEQELLERKTNLEGLLAEVEADLIMIQEAK